jgi:hypothetical protein
MHSLLRDHRPVPDDGTGLPLARAALYPWAETPELRHATVQAPPDLYLAYRAQADGQLVALLLSLLSRRTVGRSAVLSTAGGAERTLQVYADLNGCMQPMSPLGGRAAKESNEAKEAEEAQEAEEAEEAVDAAEAETAAEEAAEEAEAETVDVEEIEKGALLTSVARRQLGHPFIRGLIVAKKHETILGGVRAAVAEALCWLERIAHDNADETVLFVGCDADASRVTTSFMPNGFELPHLLEGPRAILEAHSVQMVRRLHEHGWPQWVLAAAVGGKRTSAQTCGHCGFQHSSTWVRGGCCLGCEHRVRTSGRCPFGAVGGRARCSAQAWCPHAQRCLLCDGWSCAACRFYQGDGEDVTSLVASLQPW